MIHSHLLTAEKGKRNKLKQELNNLKSMSYSELCMITVINKVTFKRIYLITFFSMNIFYIMQKNYNERVKQI